MQQLQADDTQEINNTRQVKTTFLGIRRVAFLEIALFFAIMLILDIVVGSGNRFIDAYPHPFWIIVLLITIQYGTTEGLIVAAVSTTVFLAWNLPAQQLDQSIYDYLLHIVYRPLLWFCSAVLFGELRNRHIKAADELDENFREAEEKNITITNAYGNLKKIKEKLETHMAGELHSSINAYNAIKSIGTLNPSRTLLGMEEFVKAVLDPEKFSVYGLGPDGFESAICVGWDDEGEQYSRRFLNTSPLYHEIAGRQRMLCCINDEDAGILGEEGILAGPLIDSDTGEVFGMLKIEDIGFTRLSLNNVETFRVLCEVTGIAHSNAERYRQAEANSLINMDNHLYSYAYFQQQKKVFTELANWSELSCSILAVRLENTRGFSTAERIQIAQSLKICVDKSIHDITQIFNGKKAGTDYYILLPGQGEHKAAHSIKHLEAAMEGTNDTLLHKADISIELKEIKSTLGKAANA